MRAVSRGIAALDLKGRSAVPCIEPERADLVVAGCAGKTGQPIQRPTP